MFETGLLGASVGLAELMTEHALKYGDTASGPASAAFASGSVERLYDPVPMLQLRLD